MTGGWATGSVKERTTPGRMFLTSPKNSSDPFLGQRSKRKVIRCSIRRSPRASVQGTTECDFFLIRAWRSPLGKKKPWLEKGPKRGDFLPIAARTNQSTRLLGNGNPLRTRSISAWRVTVNDLRRCWSTREIASHPREGSAMIPGSHKSNRIRNLRGPIAIATNAIS